MPFSKVVKHCFVRSRGHLSRTLYTIISELTTSCWPFPRTVRTNALVDQGGVPLRAETKWSLSSLRTPAVHYIVSWGLSTLVWSYSDLIACWFLFISKKHFRLGGMAASQWTHSVRAVRDTPVADSSPHGINTRHHIVYRHPITVSPCLLALSIFHFKQILWHCGQLWPYIGMGSLGIRLHQDRNACGDTATISPRVPSTLCSRSVTGRWEDMILPGHEDPRNLRKSKWDQKWGKIECIVSLYDKMRRKWDAVYLPWVLPNINSALLIPPPLPLSPYTNHRSITI